MTERKQPFRAGKGRGLHLHKYDASSAVYLADVSEFQPDIADATYLSWSKAVVIRAMYGDAHDDGAWYGGARRSALHTGGAQFVGIYQYLVADQDAAAQARALSALVGPLQRGEVLICDLEEGSGNQKARLSAWYNAVIAYYKSFFDQDVSKALWTYSGLLFAQNAGISPVDWVADYTSTEPSTPHRMWQFSSSYTVPGVGTCDCSKFSGTISQLSALGYGGAKPSAWSPTDWAYVAPRQIAARGGRTSVYLEWESPRQTEPAWPATAGAGTPPYPAAYTIQIWTADRQHLHDTRYTSDYDTSIQIGSLPKGNWLARVWAQGGPIAPNEAAEVTFATSG